MKPTGIFVLNGHVSRVTCVAVDESCSRVVTCCQEGKLAIWCCIGGTLLGKTGVKSTIQRVDIHGCWVVLTDAESRVNLICLRDRGKAVEPHRVAVYKCTGMVRGMMLIRGCCNDEVALAAVVCGDELQLVDSEGGGWSCLVEAFLSGSETMPTGLVMWDGLCERKQRQILDGILAGALAEPPSVDNLEILGEAPGIGQLCWQQSGEQSIVITRDSNGNSIHRMVLSCNIKPVAYVSEAVGILCSNNKVVLMASRSRVDTDASNNTSRKQKKKKPIKYAKSGGGRSFNISFG